MAKARIRAGVCHAGTCNDIRGALSNRLHADWHKLAPGDQCPLELLGDYEGHSHATWVKYYRIHAYQQLHGLLGTALADP